MCKFKRKLNRNLSLVKDRYKHIELKPSIMKKTTFLLFTFFLLIIVACDPTPPKLDVCQCLTSPGDSEFMKTNKEGCDKAISEAIGVYNWRQVNMSQDKITSDKFDELVFKCTGERPKKTPVAIIYEGTAYDQYSGQRQSLTLKVKTDFSAASLNGAYTPIREIRRGVYMFDGGTIYGIKFIPTDRDCSIYTVDGEDFATLYKSHEEY